MWRQFRALSVLKQYKTSGFQIQNSIKLSCFYSQLNKAHDTIFALSSAEGRAGVAVIRVSGPLADETLQKLALCFHKKLPRPRRASVCVLRDPQTGEVLDQALVTRFPAPKSFTGENIVEYHVHGSRAVVSGVLSALSSFQGMEMATPGQFTERAFENNKLDLMQVEGLADLLNAETEMQREQALRQMTGVIGDTYSKWRDEIIRCMAHTEALIDFGDDELDVTDDVYILATNRVRELRDEIHHHLKNSHRHELLRDGIRIAIVGPPNAGKSTLLNALAKRPAAIVSPHAGTTRDIVEVTMNLFGYPVILSDTAGIRSDTTDPIEMEGVQRAKQCSQVAHIKIAVFDIQTKFKEMEDEMKLLVDGSSLVLLNKMDMIQENQELVRVKNEAMDILEECQDIWSLSCKANVGIDEFLNSLKEKISQLMDAGVTDGAIVTRERHRMHLQECLEALDRFLCDPHEVDFAAEELRQASIAIGKILGRIDVEQILDVLFKDFCIGK